MRKGNEKFNTMITEQLMAQEDIRRAAEAEAEVTIHTPLSSEKPVGEGGVLVPYKEGPTGTRTVFPALETHTCLCLKNREGTG